ncbi:Auxin-induced protein 5NG4 [Triticum urartu]|uniref:WAT1-related protein n=1 Tax=Triticum urartu TaxID=4572 RepID=M7ZM55_TRIUA|nr:Auxin-induced protein 5NG4 [Triticum urartu]
MGMGWKAVNDAKPYLAMVLLQVGFAGMYIVAVASLKRGMCHFVLVVYRNIVATVVMAPFALYFERGLRPKMTITIFIKIMGLALLEPVLDQNLYYMGANLTSAGFATALINILPAVTFVLALILRMEKSSTLRDYPAELSLTVLICGVGSVMSTAVAVVAERANTHAWVIGFDTRLFTVVYGGIVCSGVAYYVQGIVSRQRGPVFVTAFNPLCMIVTAVMGSIILKEEITLGSVIGAVIIVVGLYFLIWGKSTDGISQVSDVSVKGASELPLTTAPNGHGSDSGKHVLGNGNGDVHVLDVETPTTNGH